jgi:hypothetical protein
MLESPVESRQLLRLSCLWGSMLNMRNVLGGGGRAKGCNLLQQPRLVLFSSLTDWSCSLGLIGLTSRTGSSSLLVSIIQEMKRSFSLTCINLRMKPVYLPADILLCFVYKFWDGQSSSSAYFVKDSEPHISYKLCSLLLGGVKSIYIVLK